MENQTGVQAATGGDSGQAEPKGYLKRLLDYAVDSPAKTLSLTVLTYGGVLLWVYFARINFLPDVNLDAVTSVLYAVALAVGGAAAGGLYGSHPGDAWLGFGCGQGWASGY